MLSTLGQGPGPASSELKNHESLVLVNIPINGSIYNFSAD